MNLDDFRVTPPHVAYEACVEEARGPEGRGRRLGARGPHPLKAAALRAADHYIAREGLFVLDERQKIRLAVERLGLSSITPFVPEKRVIEYMIPPEQTKTACSAFTVRELRARGGLALSGARAAARSPLSWPPWAPPWGRWWACSPTESGSSRTRTPRCGGCCRPCTGRWRACCPWWTRTRCAFDATWPRWVCPRLRPRRRPSGGAPCRRLCAAPWKRPWR